jgi:regulator of protease activity HflC (stomatin/prohibitin superfamily)
MTTGKLMAGAVVAGLVLIISVIAFFNFTERVPEGKVSVVYSPSGGAQEVLNPGWHLIGFFDKTQEYPTRVTIMKNDVTVTTNDGKTITMPTSYEMKVDKSKVLQIFKELGSQDLEQIQEGYLYQKLFQASRSTVSQYSVLNIYGAKTTEASAKVSEIMSESTKDLGFIVTNVTLGTPKVDKATQGAIDARVQSAQQNELKKQELQNEIIEAEKKLVVAEGEAAKKLTEAKASADATLLQARAQAESNKLLEKSLTGNVLKKMELDARAKHGWVTIQTGQAIVDTKK